MTGCVALLRAVNLGSHNKVAATDLRDLFTALGFEAPRTWLQTGNVVFDAETAPGLEARIEAELEARLGLVTDVFVRTAAEWNAVIAGNPFPAVAADDPSHLVVVVTKATPAGKAVAALRESIAGPEEIRHADRRLYVTYPDGIGRSKLTIARIEKALGTRGTGRNWNTVRKLAELVGERTR
ncbi:MAG TPA: DUF1697 domain-containing protein [Gemmatimonadota bacterium]|nr:DUF1697 domain-containing protein [Gemmatimonadota bacterium]